jgi:hypothetical protein
MLGAEFSASPHAKLNQDTAAMPTKFVIHNLSVLAYAQGFTLWHYRPVGPVNDALAPLFFDSARDIFAIGDRIQVSGATGAVDLHVAKTCDGVVVMPLQAVQTTARAAAPVALAA